MSASVMPVALALGLAMAACGTMHLGAWLWTLR